MLIALLSDIHDNTDNLLIALATAEQLGCKHLLFAGDITSLYTLRTLREEWPHGIDLVFGNNEWDHRSHIRLAEQMHDMCHHGYTADISIDNRRIFLTHFPQDATKALLSRNYDAVFYGHTHIAEQHLHGNTLAANPGEVAGVRRRPSFAVYDTSAHSISYHPI